MKNQNTSKAELELMESINLWPDPSEAPEVPPYDLLKKYLNDPSSIEDDLADQIDNSPNCRRALERIRQESNDPISGEAISFFNELRSIMSESGVKKTKKCFAPINNNPTFRFGSAWTTRSEVKMRVGNDIVKRWTFMPMDVILLDNGVEIGSDKIYRAVAISKFELWKDNVAEDEVIIKIPKMGLYVAHLWLNYPVSEEQLFHNLGELSSVEKKAFKNACKQYGNDEDVIGAGQKYPLLDYELRQERKRLHQKASWLSACADANLNFVF